MWQLPAIVRILLHTRKDGLFVLCLDAPNPILNHGQKYLGPKKNEDTLASFRA